MTRVGHVARLVRGHALPIVAGEALAHDAGWVPEAVERRVDRGRVHQRYIAADEHVLVGVGALYTWMVGVRGAVDGRGYSLLVEPSTTARRRGVATGCPSWVSSSVSPSRRERRSTSAWDTSNNTGTLQT